MDILDVGCASGRDLVAFTKLGHKAVGLDGVPEFCEMSRELSGCEVWEQDLSALELPLNRFDGIFCNGMEEKFMIDQLPSPTEHYPLLTIAALR